ncbi:MAG: hypothetical protein JRG89_20275 [Deltaproteobacteria bacterium]|nr:hypothetical protein [Deltaproteobacteria bacterium]
MDASVASARSGIDVINLIPSAMRLQALVDLGRPLGNWLLGLLCAALLAVFLARRFGGAKGPDDAGPTSVEHPGLLFYAPLLLAWLLLLASILVNLDFVKDDAYITWRYAQNLLLGNGLVFNAGEQLEGSTTFLWIFIALPFEALGLDLFQVFEILGTAMLGGLLFLMAKLHVRAHGIELNFAHVWAAVWLSCSSTATLWATSGMEQPLGMLLPTLAFYLAFEALAREHGRFALGAGVVMGLGCITRPEIHLIGIILSLPMLWRSIRTRKLERVTLLWFAGLLAVTAPTHLFRYFYFGDLLPNPFYVKTSASTLVVEAGLHKLVSMFEFNGIGGLVILSPLAFADRKHRLQKAVMAAIAVSFMLYIVAVGADEMRWHRLYLPALPFLAMLAGFGLRNLWDAARRWNPNEGAMSVAAAMVGWLVVGGGAAANFAFSYDEMNGFNGRGGLSGAYHPDMGKFIVRHERPGALVAFQDMGSTPYHAQDIGFLDFIGLTDRHIAMARHRYGLHPFAATGADHLEPKWAAEMREYFHRRGPEWRAAYRRQCLPVRCFRCALPEALCARAHLAPFGEVLPLALPPSGPMGSGSTRGGVRVTTAANWRSARDLRSRPEFAGARSGCRGASTPRVLRNDMVACRRPCGTRHLLLSPPGDVRQAHYLRSHSGRLDVPREPLAQGRHHRESSARASAGGLWAGRLRGLARCLPPLHGRALESARGAQRC